MNNTENSSHEFKDKTEALEFMVKRSVDRKRKEKWAKDFAAGRKKNEETTIIPLRKRLLRIAAAAAILILGFVAIQFLPFGNQNIDSLATNMIGNTKFLPQETTRGAALSEEELNKALSEALETEEYLTALKLYEQKTSEFTTKDKFFYAVSLAKTNNANQQKILSLTAEIMKTENEFFIESMWLSALTHLKLNDKAAAKNELEQLLRYKYQTKNVKKLLEKISS